jgi:hypothetical protein
MDVLLLIADRPRNKSGDYRLTSPVKPFFKIRYLIAADNHIQVIEHFEFDAQSIGRIAKNVLDGINMDEVVAIDAEKNIWINQLLNLIQGVIEVIFFTIHRPEESRSFLD